MKKKILLSLFTSILTLSLCACGASNSTSETASTSTETTSNVVIESDEQSSEAESDEDKDIWQSLMAQYNDAKTDTEKASVVEQIRQYGEENLTGIYRDESLGNGKAYSWKSDDAIYVLTGKSTDMAEIESDDNRKCSFGGFDGEYIVLNSPSGKDIYVRFNSSPDRIICMNYTGTGEKRVQEFYRLDSEALQEVNDLYVKAQEEKEAENTPKPPFIGMDSSSISSSTWGKPDKINKDVYSFGTYEQWVYYSKGYIYVENGIVTSISYR